MSKAKYVVVHEWIRESDLYEISRDGNYTDNNIQSCTDLPSDYYAVMEYDADEDYYFLLEDFHTYQEAWACYDELMAKENGNKTIDKQ